jgi:glycosyltransferase involved in cell wall biosynthesis
MSQRRPLKLGIIVSMKTGLGQFVYREICQLQKRGAMISLFPLKHRRGLYNPRPEWATCYWTALGVVLSQPLRWVMMPARYVAVLAEALRHGALVDFMLAAYFAPRVREVDVIYSTFGDRKLFVGYFCKRLLRKPLTVEIHSGELYVNPNPKLFAVALEACDRIVTVTEYNREVLIGRYGVGPDRVEVIRLSVDLSEYRPIKKFVILIVGFYGETKGHDVLFKAVKRLGRDDIEIWVVGGADGRSEFVDVPALAREIGVESQVAFFGLLSGPALRALYHACNVFCLPCRPDSDGSCEGFPVVLMEAMACGKPVVTTRHVEIPRIVEQIVVEENDVYGLAAALDRVYSSAALRDRLGDRNRELAETHFSPDNIARTMEVLCEIAGRTGELHQASPSESCEAPQSSCESVAQNGLDMDRNGKLAPASIRENSGAAP